VKPKRPSYDLLLVLSEAGSESHLPVWAFQIWGVSVLSLSRVPCDWKNSQGGMVLREFFSFDELFCFT
jgi:hypothetical protein